jgi:23S rRNA-/tRNA-specific pseudouridylate synthase
MSLEILKQTPHFCVVHKPRGISVHNDPGLDVCSILQKKFNAPVFPVHRIDRDTSGVLICARKRTFVHSLQSALSTGTKEYLAIVRGVVSQKEGVWKQTLSDRAEGRKNPRGKTDIRKETHTSYRLIENNKYCSMLSLVLHTGRQHQLRKHCVLAKHEIIGDKRYGDPRYQKKMQERYDFSGMTLHAHRITFVLDGKESIFSCVPKGWEVFSLPTL